MDMPIAFSAWNSYSLVTGDAHGYNTTDDTEGYEASAGINKRTNRTIEFSIAETSREIHWLVIGI